MRRLAVILFLMFSGMALPAQVDSMGCDTSICEPVQIDSVYQPPLISRAITDSLLEYSRNYIGTRYQYAGRTPSGFDCSGFVRYVYSNYGFTMPASSSGYHNFGRSVSRKACRPGDVICFTGRSAASKRFGHVGIITKVDNGEIWFIHASVQRGVIESKVSEEYYKRRFRAVRRVLP